MERLTLKRRHRRYDRCECAACAGKLTVYCTIANEDTGLRTQYLSCDVCNWKPADNKVIVPLEFSPVRKGRSV